MFFIYILIVGLLFSSEVGSCKPPKCCVFPEYPNDKTFFSSEIDNPRAGNVYPNIFINVTCQEGYGLEGPNEFGCFGGRWFPAEKIPECVRQCHLPPNPSVEYQCLLSGSNSGIRPYNEYEFEGTEVVPSCRSPIYYAPLNLRYMRCENGNWQNQPICVPDCGTVTPVANKLIAGGNNAKQGEMPWHAGIYTKTSVPYKQICGGSLISQLIIISAAHCFWDGYSNKPEAADKYAVAVGKRYRPWEDTHDHSQTSDVKEIHLTDHYKGQVGYHADDIAIVIVTTPFKYELHIRPICLDFDDIFQNTQLAQGSIGKIAGWGLTEGNGHAAQVLQVIDLPYVTNNDCYKDSPLEFQPFITGDKFCAGLKNAGKALCQGDSGGGLAFSGSHIRGKERYFLRGITSTASNTENLVCNPDVYTTFTLITKHEHFIKKYWNGEDDVWRSQTQLGDSEAYRSSLSKCIMPYSDNITQYRAIDKPHTVPGHGYISIQLNITCTDGYALEFYDALVKFNCFNGTWLPSDSLPKCSAQCLLPEQVGTNYQCEKPKCQKFGDPEFVCSPNDYVPSGAIVKAKCKDFYIPNQSGVMVCDNGNWSDDYIASCKAVCGTTNQYYTSKVPWHADIYKVESDKHTHICGGTVISERVVLSAASCFWSDGKQQPADKFAVAINKERKTWDHPEDTYLVQKSNVEGIYVPEEYRGDNRYDPNDISVVLLSATLEYNSYTLPACIGIYETFQKSLSEDGENVGLVHKWDEEDSREDVIIPFIASKTCVRDQPPDFNENFMCAGNSKTSNCSVAPGTGWIYSMNLKRDGVEEFYIRGIAVADPNCLSKYTVFTKLRGSHRTFIRKVLQDHSDWDTSFIADVLEERFYGGGGGGFSGGRIPDVFASLVG